MKTLHMISRVELKVCEGCGALWLRAGDSTAVYCRGCSALLAEFPPPRPARSASRTRSGHSRRTAAGISRLMDAPLTLSTLSGAHADGGAR